MLGQCLGRTLLAVDDDEHAIYNRAGLPQRFGGVDRRGTGRGDILQHDDLLAVFQPAFDSVAGAVLLGLLAGDHVGPAGFDGGHRDQRHRAESDARELRFVDLGGEGLGDELQTAWVGLKEILVDVVVAGSAVRELELAVLHRVSVA